MSAWNIAGVIFAVFAVGQILVIGAVLDRVEARLTKLEQR